jgi:hypothetical protein
MTKSLSILLAFICLSSGCATKNILGPDKTSINATLKPILPAEDNDILISGYVMWNVGWRYIGERNSASGIGNLHAEGAGATKFGTLAITENSIYFASWNKDTNTYSLSKRFDKKKVVDTKFHQVGPLKQTYWQLQFDDYEWQEFSFIVEYGNMIYDRVLNKRAHDHFLEIIKSN